MYHFRKILLNLRLLQLTCCMTETPIVPARIVSPLKKILFKVASIFPQISQWKMNNTAREELKKKIEDFLKFSTSTSTFCMTYEIFFPNL